MRTLHRSRITLVSMLPGLLILLLVIVGAMNMSMSYVSMGAPLFTAMAVFYWAVYWPGLMPKWFVFALGLFQDALYGTPLGTTSLLLLLFWALLVAQRRHLVKEPFFVFWLAFSVCACVLALAYWVLHCLYAWQFFYNVAIIMQLLLTMLWYPVIHKLFNMVHERMLQVI